jgi:tRNA pseudouridine38-40 synthase
VKQLPTIQETIEEALRKLCQEKVHLIGSGRTDAGVHAMAQVANFKSRTRLTREKIWAGLNFYLPSGIRVLKAEEVGSAFHARFMARSKWYRYSILTRPVSSCFLKDTAYHYPHPLDLLLMRRASRYLVGRRDFTSFRVTETRERDSMRTILHLEVRKSGPLVYIDIEADGFLHHMVRNIVGTLLEVGRGRFSPRQVQRIMRARDRRLAGPTVPAWGLCLMKVRY